MKQLMGLATALLCVSPLLAKPKPTIPVYVYIHEGAVQTLKTDTTFSGVGGGRTGSYSNTGSYAGVTVFINVSVNARTPG